MAKSKMKKDKKPKTVAELRRQQFLKRKEQAKKKVIEEKMKAAEEMKSSKSLQQISKEQEKILTEKQKKLGMAEQLRELYPELNDMEFNTLLKSQFGIQLPQQISSVSSSNIEDRRGGRRTRAQIEDFNERIRDGSKQDLENMLAQGDFSPPEIRQIKAKLKDFSIREKSQAEDERQAQIREDERRAQEEKERKIQERINKETELSTILKARQDEEKAMSKQMEEARKQQMEKEEKKRMKLQKATLEKGEKSTQQRSKGLLTQKELKEKQELERQLKKQYQREEEEALRKKIEEGFKPPKEVVVQNPNQAIAQAQEDEGQDLLLPIEGQGLIKRYALHPSHIKESKSKYNISKAGQKHIKLLKKMLKPEDVEHILNFSLLNKARNDKMGLSKKLDGRKNVKGYKLSSKGGNIIYTKI